MTVDDIIAILDVTNDRAELIAFLAPLRVPRGVSDHDRARLTSAVVRTASRVWKGRACNA
jgi:hypothetical protein